VFQRSRDGVWVGSVMLGRRPDGKPDRRTVYGKTRAEAKAKLDKLRQRAAEGMLGDAAAERLPLGAYLTRWLDTKARTVRVRTHERYRQLMEKHVVPALGHTRLTALKPDALERFYAAKLAEGLAPRTVHHIHTVLHTALEQAFRWGYVPRNAATAVSPPKVPDQEIQWLSEDEVARLLDAARADRLQGLWATAVFTGCRLGELLGLTWDAVDLDAGVLYVRKILVRVRGTEPLYGEPKTKRSRRTVPLTDDAIATLKDHRQRQEAERLAAGKDYAPYGLVFATQIGTPISGTVLRDSYKRALKRAKLPSEFRFHDLRHTAATLMLGNGVDIPTVAAILGHSRNSTTLDIYAHAVPSNLGRAVNVIQRALRGARSGKGQKDR
jgi:integrase